RLAIDLTVQRIFLLVDALVGVVDAILDLILARAAAVPAASTRLAKATGGDLGEEGVHLHSPRAVDEGVYARASTQVAGGTAFFDDTILPIRHYPAWRGSAPGGAAGLQSQRGSPDGS